MIAKPDHRRLIIVSAVLTVGVGGLATAAVIAWRARSHRRMRRDSGFIGRIIGQTLAPGMAVAMLVHMAVAVV